MMRNKIRESISLIQEADAVLVGIGSGMSSAAVFNHYHNNEVFQTYFQKFDDTYGIQNMFQGFYYIYSKPEQQWGYYAHYIRFMEDAAPGQPYLDLKEVLDGKEYFILTTNCDIQIPKVFPEDKVFQFQGDFRFFQCCQPCHDAIYDNHDMITDMLLNMDGLEVPEERIPRCPYCGRRMIPWVQDNTFLQGDTWKSAYDRYEAFVQKWHKKKLLLLELGVGEMTPSVIKLPFWDMTVRFPETKLITVNMGKAECPSHLQGKCVAIQADLAACMCTLKKEMSNGEPI